MKLEKIWVWISQPKVFTLISLGLIGLSFLSQPKPPKATRALQALEDPSSADTFIPAGYVLVPIEVENSASLDSILGSYGIVDLFQGSEKVATSLKIIRSPLKPDHFAVLVPDLYSKHLVQRGPIFGVTVKNPKALGTEFVKPLKARSKKFHLTYGDR